MDELSTNRLDVDTDGQVVAARGEIDMDTAHHVVEALASVAGIAVLDLEGVTFIDSSGLDGMLRALRRARDGGGDVILQHPSPSVNRILDLANLRGMFVIND